MDTLFEDKITVGNNYCCNSHKMKGIEMLLDKQTKMQMILNFEEVNLIVSSRNNFYKKLLIKEL